MEGEEIKTPPVAPIQVKKNTPWIIIASSLLVLSIAVGAGTFFVLQNNQKKLSEQQQSNSPSDSKTGGENTYVTESPTPSVSITPTATPTSTLPGTPTATPTPSVVTQKITLEDPVGGNTFEYTFVTSTGDVVTKAPSDNKTFFEISLKSGGSFFVQQRYEAYNTKFEGFEEVTGKLGTYFRIPYTGGYLYVSEVQKVGTCENLDDAPLPAPCGIEAFTIPFINFMAAFSCDGGSKVACDALMASMEVRKK